MAPGGNRQRILDAAHEVIQQRGVTGLTFDAVAERAGLTRAGILYHFPSREQLMLAVHRHLAERFETRLRDELGVPYERSVSEERLMAYVRVCAGLTSRAELLFMLEAALNDEASAIWSELNGRWVPQSAELDRGPTGIRRFLIRLAADGLWMYEAATGESLSARERQIAADAAIELI